VAKLSELSTSLDERPARGGKITILIGPEAPARRGARRQIPHKALWPTASKNLIRQAKLDRKEALKLAAKERGLTRRAAYDENSQQPAGKQGAKRVRFFGYPGKIGQASNVS